MIKLSKINDSSLYKITEINLPQNIKSRLGELGIIPESYVRFLFSAPSGEPRAYLIRGTQLSLRQELSENIFVRKADAADESVRHGDKT